MRVRKGEEGAGGLCDGIAREFVQDFVAAFGNMTGCAGGGSDEPLRGGSTCGTGGDRLDRMLLKGISDYDLRWAEDRGIFGLELLGVGAPWIVIYESFQWG